MKKLTYKEVMTKFGVIGKNDCDHCNKVVAFEPLSSLKYAEKIEHAQVYPMISLVIFFLFFVVLLYYVKKMDKESITTLSNIPLDDKDESTITNL